MGRNSSFIDFPLLHGPGEGRQSSAQQTAVFCVGDGVGDVSGAQQCVQFPAEAITEAGEPVELRTLDNQCAAAGVIAAQDRSGSENCGDFCGAVD